MPGPRSRLLGASIMGAVAAALALGVAWQLDPGPICPVPGEAGVSQCLAAGGGRGLAGDLAAASLSFVVVTPVALSCLLAASAGRGQGEGAARSAAGSRKDDAHA